MQALLAASALHAQTPSPTWADDVACVVYSHCTTCHHPGGAGHFSLVDYTDAFAARFAMRAATQQRVMPPWPPDHAYNALAHERLLTQQEIDLIAAWVDAGAPQGDPGNAPVPPAYTTEVVITAPDISVRMPEYVLPASSTDIYRCFVMPSGNVVDRFITGMEVIPGNTEIVHHVLVFQDTSGQASALDAADPQPGYTSFGGVGVNSAKLVGFWVPGAQPYFTPAGMGIKLLADADLVMQVHYPAGSEFQLDSTRLNLQLSASSFLRNLALDPVLEHYATLTNGPLAIPPNQVKTFHNQYTVPIPATITAIAPHAHLVCTSMRSFAVTPAADTIHLVHIPHWDFKWQGLYEFRRPVFLPAGSVLHGYATYDNTAGNPNNPNNPPQWVTLGEATTDEMMLFYFAWTFGFASDTLMVIDTASHATHYLDCDYSFPIGLDEMAVTDAASFWPNPATGQVMLRTHLSTGEVSLFDLQGRSVWAQRIAPGDNVIPVDRLPRGLYVMELRDARGVPLQRSKLVLE